MKLKTNKGITIIVLIITIIVLLILAGVSIAMLTGENGILIQASNAKVKNEIEKEKEQIKMVWNAVKIEKLEETITVEKLQEECNLNEIGATVYGDEIPTFVFGNSQRSYTINSEGTICGPSYDITGISENLKITQGGFKSGKVYIGKVATYSVSTAKDGNVEDVIIYDDNGEKVEIVRKTINRRNDDRDITTLIFEVYGKTGVRTYTAIPIDSNGKRSSNILELQIDVRG